MNKIEFKKELDVLKLMIEIFLKNQSQHDEFMFMDYLETKVKLLKKDLGNSRNEQI